jgi:hypothetical protein
VENDSIIKIFKDAFNAVLVFRDKHRILRSEGKRPLRIPMVCSEITRRGFIASLNTSFSRSISTPAGFLYTATISHSFSNAESQSMYSLPEKNLILKKVTYSVFLEKSNDNHSNIVR